MNGNPMQVNLPSKNPSVPVKYFHNLPPVLIPSYLGGSASTTPINIKSSTQMSTNRKARKPKNQRVLTSLDGLKYPGKNVISQRKLFTKCVDNAPGTDSPSSKKQPESPFATKSALKGAESVRHSFPVSLMTKAGLGNRVSAESHFHHPLAGKMNNKFFTYQKVAPDCKGVKFYDAQRFSGLLERTLDRSTSLSQ